MDSTGNFVLNNEPHSVISKVGDDDVLLGRGKRSYNHEGNVRFRKLVLERAMAYRGNQNKAFRKAMAQDVINIIERKGGKFLRTVESKDSIGNTRVHWERVPGPMARTKVKQALRDMASGLSIDGSEKSSYGFRETALPPPMLNLQSQPNINQSEAFSLFQPMDLQAMPLSLASQTNPEYARMLQIAALQQRIHECEQQAMVLQALDQEKNSQIERLIEQQRTLNLRTGLTQQQQALLRGLSPAATPNDMETNFLRSSHLSLTSNMMHHPLMNQNLLGQFVPQISHTTSNIPMEGIDARLLNGGLLNPQDTSQLWNGGFLNTQDMNANQNLGLPLWNANLSDLPTPMFDAQHAPDQERSSIISQSHVPVAQNLVSTARVAGKSSDVDLHDDDDDDDESEMSESAFLSE